MHMTIRVTLFIVLTIIETRIPPTTAQTTTVTVMTRSLNVIVADTEAREKNEETLPTTQKVNRNINASIVVTIRSLASVDTNILTVRPVYFRRKNFRTLAHVEVQETALNPSTTRGQMYTTMIGTVNIVISVRHPLNMTLYIDIGVARRSRLAPRPCLLVSICTERTGILTRNIKASVSKAALNPEQLFESRHVEKQTLASIRIKNTKRHLITEARQSPSLSPKTVATIDFFSLY